MLHFRSMYYLGNKFIVSENKAYLPFESSDLYKFGHFRNLHRISVHLPPSSLFYLFPFRNGKQKEVTTPQRNLGIIYLHIQQGVKASHMPER